MYFYSSTIIIILKSHVSLFSRTHTNNSVRVVTAGFLLHLGSEKHQILPVFEFRHWLMIAANRRLILEGAKIASGTSPILPSHSPDGDIILQTSTANPWSWTNPNSKLTLTLNPKTKLTLERGTNSTKPYYTQIFVRTLLTPRKRMHRSYKFNFQQRRGTAASDGANNGLKGNFL